MNGAPRLNAVDGALPQAQDTAPAPWGVCSRDAHHGLAQCVPGGPAARYALFL